MNLFSRMMPLIVILGAPLAHALGFANGVKIGEVTDHSVVLWTRLTLEGQAGNRVPEWTENHPNWTVPGQDGEVRFSLWKHGAPATKITTPWTAVTAEHDFCHQVRIDSLEPATRYDFEVLSRSGNHFTVPGDPFSFTTAPTKDSTAPLTFTVSTCQEFELRDDPANGHKIYQSMLRLDPAFFIQTGDTLYYDRKQPLSTNMTLARYRWHRMYSLPYQVEFHRHIPTYWMHDDHDLLKNDCWPGQKYGDLTWEQGLQIWHEQIPQSDKPYRTFRWGRHLQIWLPEGREYRSPNNMKDGPEKTILGKEQWAWLENTMKSSDATFKLYISATPVVGPDRKGKNDSHANEGFHHEGERLRKFLKSIPGCFVINGDRHWQYHSVDPGTGLHEFGCGPASDAHAQGFSKKLQEPWQDFLRIKGGFLSIRIQADKAMLIHHDVDGKTVHETVIPAG
jgi:alkaline phosphatase D